MASRWHEGKRTSATKGMVKCSAGTPGPSGQNLLPERPIEDLRKNNIGNAKSVTGGSNGGWDEGVSMNQDDMVSLYSLLCDVVVRAAHDWPVEPEGDEPLHASSYARQAANRVMRTLRELGLLEFDREEFLKQFSEEQLERMYEYLSKNND